jgi:hypothetical protein
MDKKSINIVLVNLLNNYYNTGYYSGRMMNIVDEEDYKHFASLLVAEVKLRNMNEKFLRKELGIDDLD